MKRQKSGAKDKAVLTDSKKTLIAYYIRRIKQLKEELDQLNLLDHPEQIKEVCVELIEVRENLKERSHDAWRASSIPGHIETIPGILKY